MTTADGNVALILAGAIRALNASCGIVTNYFRRGLLDYQKILTVSLITRKSEPALSRFNCRNVHSLRFIGSSCRLSKMNHTRWETTGDVIKNSVAPEGVILSFVPYMLQGANAYSNVSYMTKQPAILSTCCEICQLPLFYGYLNWQDESQVASMMEKYVRSDRHQCRYFQLTLAQKKYLTMLRHKRLDDTEDGIRKEADQLRLN